MTMRTGVGRRSSPPEGDASAWSADDVSSASSVPARAGTGRILSFSESCMVGSSPNDEI
jgi:hypothetical protein